MTMTPDERAALILKLIRRGDLDDHLHTLGLALNERRHTIAYTKVVNVEVGDFIYISADARPRLLAGRRCKVVDRTASGKLVVTPQTYINQKWNQNSRIRLPHTLVDRVEENPGEVVMI